MPPECFNQAGFREKRFWGSGKEQRSPKESVGKKLNFFWPVEASHGLSRRARRDIEAGRGLQGCLHLRQPKNQRKAGGHIEKERQRPRPLLLGRLWQRRDFPSLKLATPTAFDPRLVFSGSGRVVQSRGNSRGTGPVLLAVFGGRVRDRLLVRTRQEHPEVVRVHARGQLYDRRSHGEVQDTESTA